MFALFASSLLRLSASPASASGPSSNRLLNYQLRLTDPSGIPVADGTKNVKISFYDASTGGTRVATDCGTVGTPVGRKVVFTGGMGSVLIGETTADASHNCTDGSAPNAIIATLFDNTSLFLGITVESDAEMTPRKRVVATGYSLNADKLDDLETSAVGGSNAFVPVTDPSGNFTLTKNVTVDTNTFFVDSTLDRVGVGTVTPSARLDVRINTAGVPALNFVNGTANGDFLVNNNGFGDLFRFFTQNGAQLTINSFGAGTNLITNLGINYSVDGSDGTTQYVRGGSKKAPIIRLSAETGAVQIFGESGSGADFRPPVHNLGLHVASNGNVGVGLSPTFKLHVNAGTTVAGVGAANVGLDVHGSTDAAMRIRSNNDAGTFADFRAVNGVGLHIEVDDNDKMTILTNGNVGIGTTGPSKKLEVVGDIKLSGGTSSTSLFHNDASGGADFEFIKVTPFGAASPSNLSIFAQRVLSITSASGFGGSIGSTATGAFTWDAFNQFSLLANGASRIPLSITAQAGQSAHLFDITSNGGAAGNLFNVAGNGNVGIGVTNPSTFKLQVAGNVGPDTDDTYDLGDNTHRWRDLYLGPGTLHIGTATGDEGLLTYDTTTNTLQIDSTGTVDIAGGSGSTGCSVDASGNFSCSGSVSGGGGGAGGWTDDGAIVRLTTATDKVGIGTTAPSAMLTVNDATLGSGNGGFLVTAGDPVTPADLDWSMGGGERAIVVNGGPSGGCCNYGDLVLMNSNASPAAGNNIGNVVFAAKNGGSIDTFTGLKASVAAVLEGAGGASGGFGAALSFGTRVNNGAFTEKMRIANDGNVGIGDSTPTEGRLVVSSVTGTSALIHSSDTTGTVATLGVSNAGSGFGLPVISMFKGGALMGDVIGFDATNFGLVNGITISSASGKDIGFRVNGTTEAARITTANRFGIGTSNPYAAKLHVNNAVAGGVGGAVMITNSAAATVGSRARLGFDLVGFEDIDPTATIDARLANAANGATDLLFNAYDGSGALTFYEKMRIVGSSGNVGIGTASPVRPLHVVGTQEISSTTTHAGLHTDAASGFTSYVDFEEAGVKRANIGWVGASDFFLINDAGTTTALNTGAGNVGIGTSGPSQKLHVSGNAIVSGQMAISTTSLNGRLNINPGSGSANIFLAGSELTDNYDGILHMRSGGSTVAFDGTDSVIIGTGSPTQELTIRSADFPYVDMEATNDSDAGMRMRALSVSAEGGSQTNGYAVGIAGLDNSGDFFINEDYVAGVFAPVRRLTIDNETGNVGIATTSPGQLLHIASASANPRIMIESTSNSSVSELNFKTKDSGAVVKEVNLFGDASGAFGIYTQSGGSGGSNKLILTNAGSLGIGNTPATFKLEVSGHVGPDADDTYDLGDNTHRWRDLYLGPASIHIGTSTTDEGVITYDTSTNKLQIDTAAGGSVDIAGGSGSSGCSVDASGNFSCSGTVAGGGGAAGAFVNGGNSFGAAGTLGTNDNFALNLETNNLTRMTVDATTGNVGIGTTAPNALLEVSGSSSSTSITENDAAMVRIHNNTAATIDRYSSLQFSQGTAPAQVQVNAQIGGILNGTGGGGSGSFYVATKGGGTLLERLRVTNTGNVGIGTTTPLARLHTQNAAALSGTGTLSSSGTSVTGSGTSFTTQLRTGDTITAAGQTRIVAAIASDTALTVEVLFTPVLSGAAFTYQQPTARFADSGGAMDMILTGDGKLGVGTVAPRRGLAVQGSSTAGWISATDGTVSTELQHTSTKGFVGTSSDHDLGFITGNSTKATIDLSGKFGIGTITPDELLTVQGGNILLPDSNWLVSPFGSVGRYENYLTFSETFDNVAWTKESTIALATNAATAPDGQVSAERVATPGAATGDAITQEASGAPATASTTWTGSVWLKMSTGSASVSIRISSGNETGTAAPASLDATVWRRFKVTQAFTGSSTGTATFRIETGTHGNVLMWGAQLEKQSNAGIYALTTTPAITATSRGLAVQSAGPHSFLSGSVGIGTASPLAALHVQSSALTARFQRTAPGNIVEMYDANPTVRFSLSNTGLLTTGDLKALAGGDDPGTLELWNSQAQIGSSIGSISFMSPQNGNKTYGKIESVMTVIDSGIQAGDMIFSTLAAGTLSERMRITDVGNIGIGTTVLTYRNTDGGTSVNNKFKVQTVASTSSVGFDGATNVSSLNFIRTNTNSQDIRFGAISGTSTSNTAGAEAGYLTFYTQTGGTALEERMRIDAAGNVGIGTTSGGSRLEVRKDQNASSYIVSNNGTSGTAAGAGFYAVRDNSAGVTLQALSAGFTTSGALIADSGLIATDSGMTGGLVFAVGGTNTLKMFTNNVEALRITTSARVMANLQSTGTSALCHPVNGAGLDEITDCSGTPAADYAEMYATAPDVVTGDIVAMGERQVTTMDGDTMREFVKATVPYARGVLGVVSDPEKATDFNVIGYNVRDEDHPMPIALNGRVSAIVSSENGAIEPGDPITASATIPGAGMKATMAGMIVGFALDAFDGAEPGKLLVFVNPGWWNGVEAEGNNAASGATKLHELTVEADHDMKGFGIINIGFLKGVGDLWSIDSSGKLAAKEVNAETVTAKGFAVRKTDERKTIGRGTILAGSQAAVIENPAIKENSEIFITFRKNPAGSWWLDEVHDGMFIVKTIAPVGEDAIFSYLIVDVVDETTPVVEEPVPEPTPEPGPEPVPEPQPEPEPAPEP